MFTHFDNSSLKKLHSSNNLKKKKIKNFQKKFKAFVNFKLHHEKLQQSALMYDATHH